MDKWIAKVSINKNIVDKQPKEKQHFANGWVDVELPIEELVKVVCEGHAFCVQLNGNRSNANYKQTNIVPIDVDSGTTLQEALDNEFAKNHLTFFYTTARHTVEENRFRLVFLLDRDIINPNDFVSIKRALGLRFCGDPSTYDSSRISFGNQTAVYQIFERFIPSDVIDELIEIGKTSPRINRTGQTESQSNGVTRCTLKLPREMEVKTQHGLLTRLVDIEEKTQIHCPYHKDESVSAFVNKNANGSTYMFCIVCQMVWWVESEKENALRTYDQFEFVKIIKEVGDQVDKKQHERNLPIHIDPKKFPLLGKSSIEFVNKQYLEVEALHNGLTLIRSPKGSGKTESLTEIIKKLVVNEKFRTLEDFEKQTFDDLPRSFNTQYKVLLIGHRQALINQLCSRLGLNCYLDDDENEFQEIKNRKKRYGVCLDSIWKVKDIRYDLVIIDECEQVLAHLLADTMKNRELNYSYLKHVISSSANVVALDADLGWTSYLTLTEMRNIQSPIDQKNNRLWVIINEHIVDGLPVEIYSSKEDLIGRLEKDVAEGKKLFIASNSKRLIESLFAVIQEKFGEDIALAVTSSNSSSTEIQESISDFKAVYEKYNVFLCSPSLGTGIDISFQDEKQVVDCCYGFFESLINTHLDIDQQIRRVRHPKQVRVWISPRKFNFETEFGVIKRQLLVDRVIANTFIGFDPVTRQELYNENDEFLTLATHIVTDQRRSQNNLKKNFIDYKLKTGWNPILIAKDQAYFNSGADFFALGKHLENQVFAQNVLTAVPINEERYKEIQSLLQDEAPIDECDIWSFRRMNLELFYQCEVSNEIIELDNRGEKRNQFRLFAAITNHDTIRTINRLMTQKYSSKSKSIPFDRLKDWDAKIVLVHTLFSSTPIFHNESFDPSIIYKMMDLSDFIRTSKKLQGYIEGQLRHPVRGDIISKPTRSLNYLLKLVGLNTNRSSKKIKGEKIYLYSISPDSLKIMVDLVELRNSVKSDWHLINQIHGF